MRRPQGYLVGFYPEGPPKEADSFTCAHCQRVVFVKPRMDPADMGGLCKQCGGLICARCVGQGCTPWEKAMERTEARERTRRAFERAAGL